MKLARILLSVAALLLLTTAGFHGSGAAMVSSWLTGERGAILTLLWFVPALDWAIIAVTWIVVAWRPHRRLAPFVYITALIPLSVAVMLIAVVGASFPGIWMLLAAAALAAMGAAKLPVFHVPEVQVA